MYTTISLTWKHVAELSLLGRCNVHFFITAFLHLLLLTRSTINHIRLLTFTFHLLHRSTFGSPRQAFSRCITRESSRLKKRLTIFERILVFLFLSHQNQCNHKEKRSSCLEEVKGHKRGFYSDKSSVLIGCLVTIEYHHRIP
jgi:hypothetical protein